MSLILLEQGNTVICTNEQDLLDDFLRDSQWDGAGLPNESFYQKQFQGTPVNGELSYSPGQGGFVFFYDPKKNSVYQSLEACTEDYDDETFRQLLDDGVCNQTLTSREYWAMRKAYAV